MPKVSFENLSFIEPIFPLYGLISRFELITYRQKKKKIPLFPPWDYYCHYEIAPVTYK